MPVLIVRPHDETTIFLTNIISYLKATVDNSLFEYLEIDPNKESHDLCKKKIGELPVGSTIIFLGHGASYCLVGARSEEFYEKMFILSKDSYLFENKNVIFVSCRSAEFIRTIGSKKVFNGIGFIDLPTEWEEVMAEREIYKDAYPGINQEILDRFKKILADIIKFTLAEAFTEHITFERIYFLIKARINKQISKKILENNTPESRVLSNLLYYVKFGLTLYHNKDSTLQN